MRGQGGTLAYLQLRAILPRLMLVLALVLASARSQVGTASLSGNVDLGLPSRAATTQLWPGTYIRIDPSMPTENDLIRITVGGEWPDACAPRYRSHQIVGNVIRIDAVLPCLLCICAQVITPWSFTVEVGPLPVGLYTVEINGRSALSFLVPTVTRLHLPLLLRNH